jgi:fatty-acyl-CoA synthase
MGFGHTQRETPTADTFQLRSGGLVLANDYARFLQPGETQVGWVARTGRIPLGYFNDAEATAKTFPEVGGERVVVSGDRASLEADGTLRLYGRDSLVINTGGEKVFVEEVEEILRAVPEVIDAVVIGRPSERWGQEVVAIVAPRSPLEVDVLQEHCAAWLARFKIPKDVVFVEAVRRLGNGKADYRWAQSVATAGQTKRECV